MLVSYERNPVQFAQNFTRHKRYAPGADPIQVRAVETTATKARSPREGTSKCPKEHSALSYLENIDSLSFPKQGIMARIAEAFYRRAAHLGLRNFSPTSGTDCIVTFIVAGKEKEFTVSIAEHNKIEVGAEGMLTFKGEQYKHFVPMSIPVEEGNLEILN
jgi:hypothetical protein